MLTIVISIVIDVSEKMDDFIDSKPSLYSLVFEYYVYFIPYMYNLFSPLFIFVAVLFMTSKMASNSEVIAILSSGVSFGRFLRPYLVGAVALGVISFILNAWIIPDSEQKRISFINKNTKGRKHDNNVRNDIYFQVEKNKIIFFTSYNNPDSTGYGVTLEEFDGTRLKSKLFADKFFYNKATHTWAVKNYFYRQYFPDGRQGLKKGTQLDISLNFNPDDIFRRNDEVVMLRQDELKSFIASARERGVENLKYYELERWRRISNPFAGIILTIIGVSVSSRKVRGGLGLHLGVGILIGASFVFAGHMINTYATAGGISPAIAVWIPVIIYLSLGYYLYRLAPK